MTEKEILYRDLVYRIYRTAFNGGDIGVIRLMLETSDLWDEFTTTPEWAEEEKE